MEKIFIRERITAVDYDNNNRDILFTSSDANINGGIINVSLESDVAGWHQLTFDMPAYIIENGELIDNPLMEYVFPLSKLKYTRITKTGNKEEELILYFIVQPEEDSRDENGIVLKSYTCIDYPRHNLSKAKNGLTIGENTIDEKRSMTPNNEIPNVDGMALYTFAPVQERRNFLNYEQLGTWLDARPGAFAYIPSTNKAYRLTGINPQEEEPASSTLKWANWYELKINESTGTFETCHKDADGNIIADAVWNPEWQGYPLPPDPNEYNYANIWGDVDGFRPSIVHFYWDTVWLDPEKTIGRYDGLLYKEGSRLVYAIYDSVDWEFPEDFLGTKYNPDNLRKDVPSYIQGGTAYVITTDSVWEFKNGEWVDTQKDRKTYFKAKDILAGSWEKLDPQKAYLAPNYAEQYLDYILEGTGWKVGTVDKIYVDNNTVVMDDTGKVSPVKKELATYLYFDNSNAYNAICELCNSFKCYPRFDHVNKTVDLKAVPGDDNGLKYRYRENLKSSRIIQDGEKAVSKLWVYGGEDLNGQVYIQDCNRMNPDYYLADYTSLEDLNARVPNPEMGQYAKITINKYAWKDLTSASGTIAEIESLNDLPSTGNLGQTYYVNKEYSYYSWIPEANQWYDTYLDSVPTDTSEIIKFEMRYDATGDATNKWKYIGQFYHWWEPLSPLADNYIMDFSYFLDRKLITQEQVDDIKYNYILPISHLNRKRWPLIKQYSELNLQLLKWNNTYDSCKIAKEAIDKSLRSKYTILEQKNGKWQIKELDINAYPPGANIVPNGWTGWSQANVVYSESDAPEVANYTALKALKNPVYGQMARVKSEAQVYIYTKTFSFDDTICKYLGYNEGDIKNTKADFDKRKGDNGWLFSPDGTMEARQREEGLFEKYREQELVSDPERVALRYWYNPPSNINEVPKGPVGDPTKSESLANSYYDARDRYVTELLNMEDALERISQVETAMTLTMKKIKALQEVIDELEHGLREKYGDYIVEGVFTDDTMTYIYNLWYAGVKALNLYHRPLITYELGVVDVSGLPEYTTATGDIYHDIVYILNKPELVLPNPGDYCYITDNKLGIVNEQANITSVVRSLSNPANNQITIATVDTNTEDLIGKLVTAANTIYNKEQIYNRSAVIKSDGTIAKDNLAGSLEDNSGKMSITSNSGTVVVGEDGITTIDRNDATARMKYTGKGIFASTDGGTTWDNIVNAGKISIKALSAGTIDANNISITNIGKDATISIDGKGISAIKYDNGVATPTFNIDSLTGDATFRGTVYATAGEFSGKITANTGEIAGWQIGKTALTKGGTAISSSGDYAFWAGNATASKAPFSVKHDGTLNASKATITGDITADSGKIGNWNITNGEISNGNVRLTSDGNLIAGGVQINSGTITGTITATAGTIGGCDISNGVLQIKNANIDTLSVNKITGGTNNADMTFGGSITCNKLYASNSGTIGGFTIGTTSLSGSTSKGIMKIARGTGASVDFGANGGRLFLGATAAGGAILTSAANLCISDQYGATNDFGSSYSLYTIGIIGTYGGILLRNDKSDGRILLERVNGGLIRLANNVQITSQDTNGYTLIEGIQIYHDGQTLRASNGAIGLRATGTSYCWATNGDGTINGKIQTDQGTASSRVLKKDIKDFSEQDYKDALELLSRINLCSYKYKYGNPDNEANFGFIIDDVENLENANKFFKFENNVAKITENNSLDGIEGEKYLNSDNIPEGYVKYKNYDASRFEKYLLTVCKALQYKIDELEMQIKKES